MLKIGSLELKNRIITAPMAGISTRAYRDILRDYGAGLVWGEMISAQALVYQNRKTFDLLGLDGESFPRAVQLSGSKPEVMAEAACLVVERGAGIIDLNMGCPAPKVVRNGEGAKLMQDLDLMGQIMLAVSQAVDVPVTAKIRLGWSQQSINYVEAACVLENSGAAAITLHGRTREQFYSGEADWSAIASLKKAVSIPVIGNGDVATVADAKRMLSETACDGVMIGRAMVGNPWLIRNCVLGLSGDVLLEKPSYQEVLQQALAHLHSQIEYDKIVWQGKIGEGPRAIEEAELAAVRAMRSHLAWYIKGMPKAAAIRCRINQLSREELIKELFSEWLAQIGTTL